MKISTLRVTCKKCGLVFDAEVVVEAPVAVAVASMEAITCPCGYRDIGIGGNYVDAPAVTAPIEQRVMWWKNRGERGTSSNTIFNAFGGDILPGGRHDIPYDPGDFRRCWQLLVLIPEWRADLARVARVYPYWKPFTDRWGDMEASYNLERGTGSCPRLYALMKVAEKEARQIRYEQTEKVPTK